MKALNTEKLNFNIPSFEEVVNAFIPSEIYVPLEENQNKPKIGKKIKEGEILSSFNNVNNHSSIPGVLSEIKKITMPNGKKSDAAVIKTEGSFSYVGHKIVKSEWNMFSSSKIISLLEENGVHNSFYNYEPISNILLNVDIEKENTLGVRLFNLDPSVVTDCFIFEKYSEQVLEGAFILAKAINASHVVFFYTKEQKEIIEDLECTELPEDFSCEYLQVSVKKHSFGTADELNYFVKKQDMVINSFVDTSTCYAAYEAVALCKPVVDTFVQISGTLLKEEKFFKVKRGTPLKNLIEECGLTKKPPYKVVINGLLKGVAILDPNTPITDYVKSVTLLASKEVSKQKQYACIRCGDCFRACPVGIKPNVLFAMYHYNQDISNEYKKMAKLCSQCGRCNTVCSSRLPLYQTISLICEDN